MLIVIGLILGLLREACVIFYYKAIYRNQACLGSALTLLIGLFDIAVIAKFIWNKNWWVIIAYLMGQAIGTFVVLKWDKKKHSSM